MSNTKINVQLDVFMAKKEKEAEQSDSVFLKITHNDNEMAENHTLFFQIYYHSKKFQIN